MMTYGPADLYVVEFPRGVAPAHVVATVRDATSAGVITLMDIALVRTDEAGNRQISELSEFAEEFGLTDLRPVAPEMIGTDDVDVITEDLPAGDLALVLLIENTWARKIVQAVSDSGARVRPVERFTADVVNEVAALAEFSE